MPYALVEETPPPELVGMYYVEVDSNAATRLIFEIEMAAARVQGWLDRFGIPLP